MYIKYKQRRKYERRCNSWGCTHTHTHTHTCNLNNNKKSMKYALLKIYARDG